MKHLRKKTSGEIFINDWFEKNIKEHGMKNFKKGNYTEQDKAGDLEYSRINFTYSKKIVAPSRNISP